MTSYETGSSCGETYDMASFKSFFALLYSISNYLRALVYVVRNETIGAGVSYIKAGGVHG